MPQKNVMDVGKIGRPDNRIGTFDGAHKKWKDWIFVFGSWFQSVNPGARDAMKWARLKDQMPLTADMIAAEESAQPHIKLINSQLHCALTHMTNDDSLRFGEEHSFRGQWP